MTVQVPSSAVHGDGSVSVQEAAAAFGCSEKTIRRRIKAGTLAAHRVPTSQGYEWRVHLNGGDHRTGDPVVQVPPPKGVQLDGHVDQIPDPPHDPDSSQVASADRQIGEEAAPPADHVDGQTVHLPGHADQAPSQADKRADEENARIPAGSERALLKALELTDRLQRENMELAGRVGFLQAKLQTAEEQLLALAAPAPTQTAPDEPSFRPDQPWWKRIFGIA